MQRFLYDQRKRRRLSIPNEIVRISSESIECIEPANPENDFDTILNISNQTDPSADEFDENHHHHKLRSGRSITMPNKNISMRNMIKLPQTSKAADRYRLSNTAVAAIGNAVLMDYNVIHTANTQNIIDVNKVRRQREVGN